MLSTKHKIIFAVVYVLLSTLAFIMIKDALLHNPVKLTEKGEKKIVIKSHPIDVTLILSSTTGRTEVTYTMQDDQTINDLLNQAREDKKLLFEIARYTDHIEIIEVNGVTHPTGYKWILVENSVDVTNDIDEELLKQNGIYELKFTQI